MTEPGDPGKGASRVQGPPPASGATSLSAGRRNFNFGFRYVAPAVALLALFYAVLYVDHPPESLTGRVLAGYLRWLVSGCGLLIGTFDQTVTVQGHSLGGRFPLEIVLDCGAFDVQAIFGAAVLAFPAPWRRRAAGLVGGLMALTAFNVLRISSLYFVGALAPNWFHVMHEEVFQIAIVVFAVLLFGLWAVWAGPRAAPLPGAVEASVAA